MSSDPEKKFEKYRVPIISGIVVLLAIPLFYGVYFNIKNKNETKYNNQVFEFSQKEFGDLRSQKIKPSDFINSFSRLLSDTSSFMGAFPLVLEAADYLMESKKFASAKELLEIGDKQFSGNNDYNKILIGLRLSVVYENLGDKASAIGLLEDLAKSKVKILEGKINLDLGRLYKGSGNLAKAKEKFEYVLNNFDEEIYKKLAHLNLQTK